MYPGIIHAIQLAVHEIQRDWTVSDGADVLTIMNGTLEHQNPKILAHQLIEQLDLLQPDVMVVAGYSHAAMRAAFRWAQQHDKKTILLSDSQWCDRPRNIIKEWLKAQWISRHCDAAFVSGARAAAYAQRWGFPCDRIWRGYDVVDNDHFAKCPDRHPDASIFTQPHFLYVGRFSSEKNLNRLFQAYQRYSLQAEAIWPLVLVGSGPQLSELKAEAERLDLSRYIHWAGFQQIAVLPAYYAHASALILPSLSEPWGLVVNESMAAGLPVLVSDRCGCVPDLVFPGINGYVFDPTQPAQLAEAMLRVTCLSDSQRQQMGEASRQIIAHYTPTNWAIALSDCVQTVFQGRPS
jgi:glycosyltransferase involved in cell wall biosynthesis